MIWLKIKKDNMPGKLIPGEKKTAVYKKSSGFKMKSSPAKMHGKKASAVKNYKKGYYGA